MIRFLISMFEKYETFEQWVLTGICKIRGHHKYVKRKCDVCGFEIKVIQGEKKDYTVPTRSVSENQRKAANKRVLSNQSKSR